MPSAPRSALHDAPTLTTPRLLLRGWQESDRAPFAAMSADPEVMKFYMMPLTRAESDMFIARMCERFTADGLGFFAVEQRDTGAFIGAVGLARLRFDAHFTPAVEIGWRLARDAWGQGFASEAALAALQHGFAAQGLKEIVAFAVVANAASRKVMDRIGMVRDAAGDFDHPSVPQGHPSRRHVLYRARR